MILLLRYFSEKLIDSLYTKTIPIYWGCPNIDNWFNTKTILTANTINDIIEICNNLDDSFYKNNVESIEENFNKCKEFLFLHTRVCDKIEKIVSRYE